MLPSWEFHGSWIGGKSILGCCQRLRIRGLNPAADIKRKHISCWKKPPSNMLRTAVAVCNPKHLVSYDCTLPCKKSTESLLARFTRDVPHDRCSAIQSIVLCDSHSDRDFQVRTSLFLRQPSTVDINISEEKLDGTGDFE